ncbi:MAG: hypothetical protein QW445_07570 [Candidatus Bathyarchaeia archaeon]
MAAQHRRCVFNAYFNAGETIPVEESHWPVEEELLTETSGAAAQ